MNRFVTALESKYQAKIDEAISTLDLYMSKSVGVGEHPNIIDVLDEYVSMLEVNTAKLNLVKNVFSNQPATETDEIQ
jgi:hypothetical protein